MCIYVFTYLCVNSNMSFHLHGRQRSSRVHHKEPRKDVIPEQVLRLEKILFQCQFVLRICILCMYDKRWYKYEYIFGQFVCFTGASFRCTDIHVFVRINIEIAV